MHDTVINNAFFAFLAIGGTALGLQAVAQVVFPSPTVEVSATLASWAMTALLGA